MSDAPEVSGASAAAAYPVNEDGWPLAPGGYVCVCEVGQGAFARVMKAECPAKGVHVAVKIMSLENLTTSLEEIQSEVRAMKLSRHECVLDLLAAFVVRTELWLVMPLMDKGSCYYVMRQLRKTGRVPEGVGLPEDAIATLLRELLRGLDYIHSHSAIHRDIKAGNILLNSEGRVAIADFGVAGWLSDVGARGEGERKTFVGTPCWMAPEVMEQRGYNQKADIWSVGITALELAKGYAPYSKFAPMSVLIKTIKEPPPSLDSYGPPPPGAPALSDKFRKFVELCLKKDPRQRPSAHELLVHPFIKKAKSADWLAETLLRDIAEVGTGDAKADDARPRGYQPVSLAMVPGTTWVFPEDPAARSGDAEVTLDDMDREMMRFGGESAGASPAAAL